MTGTQSMYALGGAFLFVVFLWFLAKLFLRLAGRRVVKVYPVVLQAYPPPTYIQAPPPAYPPGFAYPPQLSRTIHHETAEAEEYSGTGDEQFDDIVRNYYSS